MGMIRVGLLGYGAWGQEHARFINENGHASLIAIAENTQEGLKEAEEQHKVRTYSDYRELIASEDLDIVDITLPDYLHYEAAITALKAGNNVLLEKPMALTVRECDRILEIWEGEKQFKNNEPLLAIGFELRASSLWGRVKKLIQNGKIGDPRALNMEVFRCAPYAGVGGWRHKKNRASEWILDGPIHYIDLIRWYFQGIAEPQKISAKANSLQENTLIDNFLAITEFSNNNYASLFYTIGGYRNYITTKVIGEDGAIWAYWGEGENGRSHKFFLEFGKGKQKQEITLENPAGEIFDLKSEIDMVIRAVKEGEPPPATGHDGREAVRLCLAAAKSLERGDLVKL